MESIDDDDCCDYRIIVNETDFLKRHKLIHEAFDKNYDPLDETILADDGESFVDLSEFILGDHSVQPDHMWFICHLGAINCASVLLERDTIPRVDINTPVTLGLYPLEVASKSFHYDLVDLFLRHGACTDYGETNGTPLKSVLDMLNYHAYLIDWNLENSIYTLVTILCLPQMKIILETIKLLAWNTEDVNEVFNYYAQKEEDKLSQMAVLLMVAKELLRDPLLSKGAYQNLKQEFEFLASLEKKLLVETNVLKERMAYLMSALALFELFERAGDAIMSYLQSRESNLPREIVIKGVARILKEAQFVLKDGDIDLSNIDRIKPGMTVPENGSFSKHKVLHPLDYESRFAKRKHLPNSRNRELVKQHELSNMFNPPLSPALRIKPQTNCFLRCCPNVFYKPMKAQNKGITTATLGHLLLFKQSNLLASCAFT